MIEVSKIEYAVTHTKIAPRSKLAFTSVVGYFAEGLEYARKEVIDRRGQNAVLWQRAPEGYLGPCLTVCSRMLHIGSFPKAIQYMSTAEARHFLSKLPFTTNGTRESLSDPWPLMATPEEIATYLELSKKVSK